MHERCAVNHTFEGGPCRRPATVEYFGELVCEHHARRFDTVGQDHDAYLEEVAFLIEVWLRGANRESAAETVSGLEAAREKAALELDLARVDLELANWDPRMAADSVSVLLDA